MFQSVLEKNVKSTKSLFFQDGMSQRAAKCQSVTEPRSLKAPRSAKASKSRKAPRGTKASRAPLAPGEDPWFEEESPSVSAGAAASTVSVSAGAAASTQASNRL